LPAEHFAVASVGLRIILKLPPSYSSNRSGALQGAVADILPQEDIMEAKLREQIVSIIGSVDDMTIATIREDGFPQATTVSYISDGPVIYFITGADAQKAHNIARNNKVSLTINRAYDSWNEIEGLSMGGLAIAVTDPKEIEKIGRLLLKKFPQAMQYEPDEGGKVQLSYFRIEPKVISILDYKKGFGHTELVEM
jgi:general stress protein 26